MSDDELADLAEGRAAMRDSQLTVAEADGTWTAAFVRDTPALGQVILMAAETGDRRGSIISLLRSDDIEQSVSR